jgi:hypothetical protein
VVWGKPERASPIQIADSRCNPTSAMAFGQLQSTR